MRVPSPTEVEFVSTVPRVWRWLLPAVVLLPLLLVVRLARLAVRLIAGSEVTEPGLELLDEPSQSRTVPRPTCPPLRLVTSNGRAVVSAASLKLSDPLPALPADSAAITS